MILKCLFNSKGPVRYIVWNISGFTGSEPICRCTAYLDYLLKAFHPLILFTYTWRIVTWSSLPFATSNTYLKKLPFSIIWPLLVIDRRRPHTASRRYPPCLLFGTLPEIDIFDCIIDSTCLLPSSLTAGRFADPYQVAPGLARATNRVDINGR